MNVHHALRKREQDYVDEEERKRKIRTYEIIGTVGAIALGTAIWYGFKDSPSELEEKVIYSNGEAHQFETEK